MRTIFCTRYIAVVENDESDFFIGAVFKRIVNIINDARQIRLSITLLSESDLKGSKKRIILHREIC